MATENHSLRNQLALGTALLLIGILLSVYGLEPLGAPLVLAGFALVVVATHRLGRAGA